MSGGILSPRAVSAGGERVNAIGVYALPGVVKRKKAAPRDSFEDAADRVGLSMLYVLKKLPHGRFLRFRTSEGDNLNPGAI
jgi:hypothetical protein